MGNEDTAVFYQPDVVCCTTHADVERDRRRSRSRIVAAVARRIINLVHARMVCGATAAVKTSTGLGQTQVFLSSGSLVVVQKGYFSR